MTDIFISYAREDRPFAAKVAKALTERGFKVWWDWELIGGDNYRFRIREVIGEAKKTIVLWSKRSTVSAFVVDEASEAKKFAKLIPVSIDGSPPPFGFGDLHTIALDEGSPTSTFWLRRSKAGRRRASRICAHRPSAVRTRCCWRARRQPARCSLLASVDISRSTGLRPSRPRRQP